MSTHPIQPPEHLVKDFQGCWNSAITSGSPDPRLAGLQPIICEDQDRGAGVQVSPCRVIFISPSNEEDPINAYYNNRTEKIIIGTPPSSRDIENQDKIKQFQPEKLNHKKELNDKTPVEPDQSQYKAEQQVKVENENFEFRSRAAKGVTVAVVLTAFFGFVFTFLIPIPIIGTLIGVAIGGVLSALGIPLVLSKMEMDKTGKGTWIG